MTPTEVIVPEAYKPFTVKQALETDLPGDLMAVHKDEIQLAQTLTTQMIPGMTDYQISEFVIGDIPDRVTPTGVHQQCLREIGGRYESVISMQAEWEKNQATIELHQVTLDGLCAERDATEDPLTHRKLDAKIKMKQAALNDLLRRMPMLDLKARDVFRQLQAFIAEYRKIEPLVPKAANAEEQKAIDKAEWEARVIVRYFKGRLNYIPGGFDVEFLRDAIELAMFMREHFFSDDELRIVACVTDQKARWEKAAEIIEKTGKLPITANDLFYPIDAQDQLPGMILQKLQVQARIEQLAAGEDNRIVTPTKGFRGH